MMQKHLWTFGMLFMCTIVMHASPERAWVNALAPKGEPSAPIRLARDGRALYTILLPERPNSVEQKAAQDLAHWLSEISGATFRITQRQGMSPCISIGATPLMKRSRHPYLRPRPGADGYAIAVDGRDIILIGGDRRGIINAVYALLEEDLGCRWYTKDVTVIPRHKHLTVTPVSRAYTPPLEIRDPFYYAAFNRDWSLRNRTNSPSAPAPEEWGGHIDYALFVHTYNTLMPPDEFFKDHPEYYSELNGVRQPRQLCLSHPDVLRIVTERVKRILRDKPHSEIISVSPNDWTDYCTCTRCKETDAAEGSYSGTLIRFVNAVAEAIEPEHPGVQVSTLAYLGTFMPPTQTRPRHNVAIQLCTDSHAWAHPFLLIRETSAFQRAMKAWHAVGANIHIWDYTVNFSHHLAPMPNMPVVTDSIRYFVRNGAKGVMLQGFYECNGTENVALRNWVWAKQLWDPTLDTLALMQDFIYGYYGEAAEPIWEYNMLLWNLWYQARSLPKSQDPLYALDIRYRPDVSFLSSVFLDTADSLMAKAMSLAQTDEIRYRVRVARLPILYTRLSQGIGFQRDWGGPFKPGNMTADEVDTYREMLAEFEDLVKPEKITTIQEGANDMTRRIQLWRDQLRVIAGGH